MRITSDLQKALFAIGRENTQMVEEKNTINKENMKLAGEVEKLLQENEKSPWRKRLQD